MATIMIFGANSAVAEATARLYANSNDNLILVGRNLGKLQTIASDLQIRGAKQVEALKMDATDYDSHQMLFNNHDVDVLLVAHGQLTDQNKAEQDFHYMKEQMEVNLLSIMSVVGHAANYFEKKKSGTIAVIGSVAGDRGRMSNYVYGTAKGAIELFLQGVRHRLAPSGVNVLCIKPGFIDSPMTAHIEPKGALWAKPAKIAKDIVAAIKNKKAVIYTPCIWYFIMTIIKNVPSFIFHKTKL